jgi:hypothetical protein
VVTALLLGTGVPHPDRAWAGDGEPPVQAEPVLRSSADLDGDYLMLAPGGGAIRSGDTRTWDSAFGGSLIWLRVAEHRTLAAGGLGFGGSRYAARDGGRLWLDAIAGTRRLGGWLIGGSIGGVVELQDTQHARPGASAAIWAFVGITPFVRAGFVDEAGTFIEIGATLPLPVWRF